MVTGLLGLSAFPHQEARFLTPMLLPLVFLFARHTAKVPRTFWVREPRALLTYFGSQFDSWKPWTGCLDDL